MSKKYYVTGVLLAVGLFLLCLIYISFRADTYVIRYNIPRGLPASSETDFQILIDQGTEAVELTDVRLEDNVLTLTVHSVNRGKAFVITQGPDEFNRVVKLYSHRFGIITADTYFGDCTGGMIVPFSTVIFLAFILWAMIRKYRFDVRQNLYQYLNILELGVIIFLVFLLMNQIPFLIRYHGPDETIRSLLDTAKAFVSLLLPGVSILAFLATVSNLDLMRHEGLNWRNMLGCILGLLVCFATIFPYIFDDFAQKTTLFDVHNQQGAAYYITMFIESGFFTILAYLECILIGTILFAFKTARYVPAFDKDYILILGCQVNKDGTPTRLLKARADRAVEFTKMQKEATGKDLMFVPSGGKGSDEVIPEAESIRRYLIGTGIPGSRILVEDKSVNTFENMKNSAELIRRAENGNDPKIAFATTNYHVLRAGIIASELGIRTEGIGSWTMSYFWVNAFVREFAATIFSEKRIHIRVAIDLLLLTFLAVLIMYLSYTL